MIAVGDVMLFHNITGRVKTLPYQMEMRDSIRFPLTAPKLSAIMIY